MIVTPELVRVEMDYRMERALSGESLEHLRVARGQHRPWWRRAFGHRDGTPSTTVNRMRPAT